MIKGGYDILNDIAKNNVCAEHKTNLEVAWSSDESTYYLRCGVCGPTKAITRNPSLTQQYRQGSLPEGPIADNVNKGIRRQKMSNDMSPLPTGLDTLPTKDLATGEQLDEAAIKALVEYANRYKLDPVRGHVVLMYSKPYITIDGYLFAARRAGTPYTLESRPMTTDEIKSYKVGETDYGWLAKVSFMDTGASFTGTGIVTYDEMTARSPRDNTKPRSPVVAAHPWQLAQKRAEWQALRRAFPIGDHD